MILQSAGCFLNELDIADGALLGIEVGSADGTADGALLGNSDGALLGIGHRT